jgi:tetratricopeptide (TPR) repeat protein
MNKTHRTNIFLSLYDLDKNEGCIAITATISMSKATMCRMVLGKGDNHIQSASILDRLIYEEGLLESIPKSFDIVGQHTEKRTRKEMIYQLVHYLIDALHEGEGALVIIEDAQTLPLSVPDEKSVLLELNKNKNKLLQVILVGKNANMQVLKSPQLKQLYQKFSAEYSLSQSKNEELQKNLENRLMTLDSNGGTVFFPETLALIRQHSLGIPCMINFIISSSPICTFTNHTIEKADGIVPHAVEDLKIYRKEIVKLRPEKSPVGPDIVKWVRTTFINPAIVTFFIRVGTRGLLLLKNAKTKKTIAWPNSINLIRKNYLVPAIVVISISVGAIIYFISKDTNIIEVRGNKLEHDMSGLNEVPPITLGELDIKGPDVVPIDRDKKELLKLAVSHSNKGEFVIARDQYKELVRRFPMDHELHNNLGSVYMKLGDFDAAINEYKKSIHIKPNYLKARNNLGVALYEDGNFQAAINEFNIILETNPKDVQCITNLGVVSKKLGNPDKARKLFKEALSIDPAYDEAHYNLAVALEQSEVDKAIFHFQKYLEYSSDVDSTLEEEVMQRLDVLYNKQKK